MRTLKFSKQFDKSFSGLDSLTKIRVMKTLEKFENDGLVDIHKIKGTKNSFRIRVGSHRMRLEKMNNEWLLIDIRLRKDAYKK